MTFTGSIHSCWPGFGGLTRLPNNPRPTFLLAGPDLAVTLSESDRRYRGQFGHPNRLAGFSNQNKPVERQRLGA